MDIVKQQLMKHLNEELKNVNKDVRINTSDRNIFFVINSESKTFQVSNSFGTHYHLTHLGLFVDLIRDFSEDALLDFVKLNDNTISI